MDGRPWTVDQWMGCYPSNWKGVIVEEAMAHPAKFSSKLIRRIYNHLSEMGWVKEGDTVLDPFGGVALGAFDAMRLGLAWYGVELEARFHRIGNQNIEAWDSVYGDMHRWGRAKLLQGDSRKLLEVLDFENWVTVQGGKPGITCQVTSPPYAESIQTSEKGSGIDYSKAKNGGKGRTAGREAIATGYGRAEGQLGAMKAEGFTAAISSPPFLQSDGGTPEPKPGGVIDRAMYERHAAGNHKAGGYGRSEGQLHHMNASRGSFDAAVSSPPYEGGGHHAHQMDSYNTNGGGQKGYERGYADEGTSQLANQEDFWLAAREIVEQVYLALADGGHAVWVVKDYVKNKQVVPFCDQWRQLCEAAGFVTLHEHHAMLVHGRQMTLEGGVHVKESKSFFRRIAEKNGSPRIDFEVVYCMVKPTADGGR